ncbi:MAG: SAM-dependent methyltransferase [Flavobacteriaceae bacterium]|nr:SAM-dependent methyltransferase [Flavobacteriaceae bacterium]|tara:strand:+ start:1349 stop:2068 length:720 start_codon:yes stop_codon:yes gene_type:complete
MSTKTKGRLFLIPNVLGDTAPLEVMPISVKKTIEALRCFVFEKEKAGRAFIKSICPNISQDNIIVHLLNKFTNEEDLSAMLLHLQNCEDVGLITDAGCPGVADPGAALVARAHANNIRVIPLVGPSSILLAVMAAGLNGQSFAFNGYLPIEKGERRKAIKQYEKKSIELNQTQVFIETPYRNNALLDELSRALRPKTLLSVACDITLPKEFIKTATVEAWRNNKEDLHKRPAVFSLLGG